MITSFLAGSLIGYLGPVLGSLYDEFSYALYRYTHNVIASGLLSETLQNTLLAQLGVSPWTPDGDWPLQVLPRTLTVLAQVSFFSQKCWRAFMFIINASCFFIHRIYFLGTM